MSSPNRFPSLLYRAPTVYVPAAGTSVAPKRSKLPVPRQMRPLFCRLALSVKPSSVLMVRFPDALTSNEPEPRVSVLTVISRLTATVPPFMVSELRTFFEPLTQFAEDTSAPSTTLSKVSVPAPVLMKPSASLFFAWKIRPVMVMESASVSVWKVNFFAPWAILPAMTLLSPTPSTRELSATEYK